MDSTSPTPLHVLLAGGGTGGHVFPALAVADELQARGWKVSFTGAAGGLEERLVSERGLFFHPLAARPLVGRGPLGKAQALATVARSGIAAAKLIRGIGARVVLGTGGYVSAPAVLGARLARRPVLLLEPNGRAGVANRWLSRWATAAAVGYRETIGDLKCPCWVTGVPVRKDFFAVPAELPPMGSPRLLVLGGSQGARQINQAMAEAAARLIARLPALSILHQAGSRNLEETRAAYESAGVGAPHVEVVPFLEDVAGAMAASHLLVSRAGAITVAEICAAGRPSLLIPLAIAQGHQVDNARLLTAAGGAEMIRSDHFSAERLAARVAELLADAERLMAMGRAARSLARPRAVADIADRLEELGGAG
ncbi:MAG TPA: undecaprenyldiphospho-muramoylpentapeptide beta-N-acetylglucosaminyltransferase [Thermoanaerobaculia bacterium]|jgi:UDP-N-acetylglucosamine--N-acetylmuramyl-(pentapeptide) pyrophosphoryl-undecaprenol N-acetylglucosamine transferase|nr:undecaprenyldiphospho-muramoylpentapeptide beta-N-acetylglucosaminyltransferase [Thermoanaerobaculia bacterium]